MLVKSTLAALAASIFGLLFVAFAPGRHPDDPLQAADKAFADHAYQASLDNYRIAVKDPRFAAARPRIQVRIGVCLDRLGKPDDALAHLKAVIEERGDNLSQARALLERGVIALVMQHYRYEKDGVKTRGEYVQGATYHWTAIEDYTIATEDLGAAAKLLAGEEARGLALPTDERRDFVADHLRANLELASALEAARDQGVRIQKDGTQLEGQKAELAYTERIVAAFDVATEFQVKAGNQEGEALARYLKGAACRRQLSRLAHLLVRGGDDIVFAREGEEVPSVAVPAGQNPIKVLQLAFERCRSAKIGDEILFALATTEAELGLFVDAVTDFQKLVAEFPKSEWIADAQWQVEQITFPRLTVEGGVAQVPGKAFEVGTHARNIPRLDVALYRFPLSEVYLNDGFLDDAESSLGEASRTIKSAGGTARLGAPVHQFTLATDDDGRHREKDLKLPIPALPAGCYLLEAQGAGLTWQTLVQVSSLGVVEKIDQQHTVAFVVDRLTGEPVKGADVVVRERYYSRGLFSNSWKVRYTRGTTDARGIYEREHGGSDPGSFQIEIFASQGDRAAFIERTYAYRQATRSESATAYVMTDRPVYRPGDPIRIAAVVRTRRVFEYQALAHESFDVLVQAPNGQQVFKQTLVTDDSGALRQEIVLEKEPPLGVYQVQITAGKRHIQSGSFRVEEYQKPEFQVTVALPTEQVRLGEKVTTTIAGDYYFGGGVAGGAVQWRVFREEYWPSFPHDVAYSYLYGEDAWWGHRWRAPARELVTSGAGVLNGDGRLEVRFDTAAYAQLEGEGSRFIIEADVTDSSRRTLSGSGALLVAKHALVLDVSPRQGFYAAGDTVECEIQSRLPAGGAVAVKGTMRVFRIEPATGPDGKPSEKRTPVHEAPLATDDQGRAFFRWTADEGGLFAIAFEALDKFETATRGEARLWVQKPGFGARDFAFKNIELTPNRRTFKPGEKASILVTSNFADSALFVSLNGDDRMLQWDVIRMDGKMAVIEIPITVDHVPNFHVHVASVRGGEFFEDQVEIFVPPADRFLDVGLAFGKPEYRPGTTGELVITTRGADGKPVAARAAVTVLDASILDIQADETPDIRKFFWGDRRGNSVSRSSSAQTAFDGVLVKNAPWGRYELLGRPPAWGNRPGLVSRLLGGVGFGAGEFEQLARDDVPTMSSGKPGDGGEGGRVRRAGGKVGLLDDVNAPEAKAAAPGEEKLHPSSGAFFSDGASAKDDEDDSRAKQKESAPKVRSDFRDSALWTAEVVTDATGRAVLPVPFPESLTTWRAKSWVWTADTLVGQATASTRTSKDLLVRLRAPRFFVEGDVITVSALVNNRTASPQTAAVKINFDGDLLATSSPAEASIDIPAGAARRVDWSVDVRRAGTAKITVQAIGSSDSDAMVKEFPVYEWGHDKRIPRNAVMTGEGQTALAFTIPAERRVETTRIDVTLEPSLALTLLDALPYLIDYPYGCTEQTVSRFIPAVAVARTLAEAGTTLDQIAMARRNGLRASKPREHDRVVTQAELDTVIRAGLARLQSLQHDDGGFGWWKADRSSPYLTAYALSGLLVAAEADLAVPPGMIDRAVAFLAAAAPKEQQLEQATFAAYVLARARKPDTALMDRIFTNRDTLNPYGKALLASALAAAKDQARAKLVLTGLVDLAKRDVDGGTAHWAASSRQWWWWWNNVVETHAAILAAFVDVDPTHELVQPLVKWLVTNRRGGRWQNTRDTAQAVLALVRYARAAGELDPDLEVLVRLGDLPERTVHIDRANLLTFDPRIGFDSSQVPTGDVRLTVRTRGKGRVYVSADATFFTKEADITAAGEDLLVERQYVRVIPKKVERTVDGRATQVMEDTFEPISSGAAVTSGDVIEVRLKIDAKNDFDYLLFEDLKPAGFEPLETKSGATYADGVCSNIEFRDARTAMFVTWLQQGTHTLAYRLRAELPGTLRARPARGEAMYASDISGTSSSFRFQVRDSEQR